MCFGFWWAKNSEMILIQEMKKEENESVYG